MGGWCYDEDYVIAGTIVLYLSCVSVICKTDNGIDTTRGDGYGKRVRDIYVEYGLVHTPSLFLVTPLSLVKLKVCHFSNDGYQCHVGYHTSRWQCIPSLCI